MSKLIDALTRAKPRLLAMSPLIAAGAVASVAAAPALTTGVAIIAALQTLSGIAGNILASDVHAKLSARVLRDDVLKNHDLARAVRDAINVILLDTANDIADKHERAALEQMARADASVWAEAEALLRQPQTIEGLATSDVIEMFSKSADEFAGFKALDLAAWRDIVGGLAAVHSFAVEGDVLSAAGTLKLSKATVDLAAARLHETFPRALYEILKADFAGEGEAYGGLLIKLVGNISDGQVKTLAAAYKILDKTTETLKTAQRIEGKVDSLHDKFDAIQVPPVTTPARLTSKLPPHNRIFTGRRDVLDALRGELAKHNRAALSGMPGVGKTQTATQYAHEQYAAQAYAYVIYARAATETELLTDFVSAAQALNLPAKNAADINQVAAAVKAWLEGVDNWLLIFDNADDLTVVHAHIPANQKGHVVFTRRPADAGGVAHTIRIRKMGEDEGALLLLRRAELVKDDDTLDAIAPESAAQARAISREIDGLPLSLDIAGAFIKETSTSLDEYLTLYRTEGKALRQQRDAANVGYEHSVATAFALAFRQVATPDNDSEESAVIARAAADVLRLCAFLAPGAIPLELIFAKPTDLGEALQRALGNMIWRKKSIARATRYSLLDANPQAQTYDMHREVQAVMRDEMDEEAQRLWTERALQSLAEVFPDVAVFANWETCDLILPHVQACLEHGDKLNIKTEIVARLKNKTGFHLTSRARYEEAESLFKQALELCKKLLGLEHPDVAASMNNLAALYVEQGRYEEAEPLYEQALELKKKLFGLDHPDVATGMNNLAELYRVHGRYEEAEPLYEQALELRKKLLGLEHPAVATSMNNLATLAYAQGRYEAAAPLYKQALELRMKVHGLEHPDVAQGMNNLAVLYKAQGRYEESGPLHEQALELRKKLLGLEHPDVAQSLNNLAGLYRVQGRYKEAEPLFKQALAMVEKMLGVNHPHTRLVRRNFEMFQKEKAPRELEQSNGMDEEEKDSD